MISRAIEMEPGSSRRESPPPDPQSPRSSASRISARQGSLQGAPKIRTDLPRGRMSFRILLEISRLIGWEIVPGIKKQAKEDAA